MLKYLCKVGINGFQATKCSLLSCPLLNHRIVADGHRSKDSGSGIILPDRKKRIVLPVVRKPSLVTFRRPSQDGWVDGPRPCEDEKLRGKVVHVTASHSLITSHIDHELSLLDVFRKSHEHGGLFFRDSYVTNEPRKLVHKFCKSATRCWTSKNAGGNSIASESLSMHYFFERFHARKFLLEMEIRYNYYNWKMCDFICTLYAQRVGVSVTRAMSFPNPDDFTREDAHVLLKKKMSGLLMSRTSVVAEQSFQICFLHIWCQTPRIAALLETAFPAVIAEDDTDTFREIIVLATVYAEKFIFQNRYTV